MRRTLDILSTVIRFLPLLFLWGCAGAPCDDLPSGKELKDPTRLLPVFREFMRCGEYAKAHKCLMPGAMSYEEFYLGFTAFKDTTAHLVRGLVEHGIDASAGTIRLCNPEFGVSRDFRIARFKNLIWTFDFTEADIRYFQDRALAWFRKQTQAADYRIYTYPPNWTYARVDGTCSCAR